MERDIHPLERYQLYVLVLSLLLGGLFGLLLALTRDPLRASAAFAGFALLPLAWRLAGLRGRERGDERDREIARRAQSTAYAVFWLLFVLGSVGTALWLGEDGQVPASLLGALPLLGMELLLLLRSAAALVLYRRM